MRKNMIFIIIGIFIIVSTGCTSENENNQSKNNTEECYESILDTFSKYEEATIEDIPIWVDENIEYSGEQKVLQLDENEKIFIVITKNLNQEIQKDIVNKNVYYKDNIIFIYNSDNKEVLDILDKNFTKLEK